MFDVAKISVLVAKLQFWNIQLIEMMYFKNWYLAENLIYVKGTKEGWDVEESWWLLWNVQGFKDW